MALTIAAVVCAYNERQLLSACLHSLRAQTRLPDEILVINNASTDDTAAVAAAVEGVRVIDEPTKGLVIARETARRDTQCQVIAYVDADCRPPITWLERGEAQFLSDSARVAVTGAYRFFDWDRTGRGIVRLSDVLVPPPTLVLVHPGRGVAAILYGGNFAV